MGEAVKDYELAILLRPFAALVILAVICIPVRYLSHKYLPKGRIRDILLTRLDGKKTEPSGGSE